MKNQSTASRILKTLGLFINAKTGKQAFYNNHLVRRKYIVAHAASVFGKNKLEPAPLLGLELLYIGCKSSKLAEELTFRGAEVTIIDPNPAHISKARESAEKNGANITFIEESPIKLLEKGAKFDLILCMDVFEYEDKLMEFLYPTANLLKEKGALIFSCFNKTVSSYLWHILFAEIIFKWTPRGTFGFAHFRSPRRMRAKLGKSGLKVVDLCGIRIDPFEKRWRRCKNPSIRYIGTAVPRTSE